jgi:hypothetical protein
VLKKKEVVTMADETVARFNLRIAELIRSSRPEEIIEILRDDNSLLRRPNQNIGQQQQHNRSSERALDLRSGL